LDNRTVISTIWDKQHELMVQQSMGHKMTIGKMNGKNVKEEQNNGEDVDSDV
jgi:hypothetical protein